jgi:Cu2+-exporting ATPase
LSRVASPGRGVVKQLAKLPGVHLAEGNYVAGSATVVYNETVTDFKAIKAKVHECGYHCTGEMLPKHLCAPEDPPANG